MATYTLEVRPGSPGYVFATRDDGARFDIYLQYASIEPRIEDATERAALVAQARAYLAPAAPAPAPRDRSHDIPDVSAEMQRAGFGEAEEQAAIQDEASAIVGILQAVPQEAPMDAPQMKKFIVSVRESYIAQELLGLSSDPWPKGLCGCLLKRQGATCVMSLCERHAHTVKEYDARNKNFKALLRTPTN